MKEDKQKISPLVYIIIGAVIFYVLQSVVAQTKSEPPTPTSIPTTDPYAECISWAYAELSNHSVADVCIIGTIAKVTDFVDENSGETVYEASFSRTEETTRLISVGQSLYFWEGKCVVVRGRMIQRDGETRSHMLNIDGEGDFTIEQAPSGKCP
jgi:hypothetical protein